MEIQRLKKFDDFINEDKNDLSSFIKVVKKAKKFAEKAHKGQKRRGGEDYISHPEAVMRIVHAVKKSRRISQLVAAAALHDVVEDTDVTIEDIEREFGKLVASIVAELTSDESALEIFGKEKYLIKKMLDMSSWGLVIKLADRLHNINDVPEKLENGTDKEKRWAKKYITQTHNIIIELEQSRELSPTQTSLVNKIKKQILKSYDIEW